MNPSNLTRSVLALLYALTVTTALTGCGGQGDSADTSSNGGTNVAEDSDTGADESVRQNLDNLHVDQDNELVNANELEVVVQVNGDRSFLTICAAENYQSGGDQIDFENCILRAPLDDALSSFKLTLPNHIDSLVAIVWFYEADKQPLVRKWKRSKNGSVSIEGIWRVADYG